MKYVGVAVLLVIAVAAALAQEKPKLIVIVSVNSGLQNPQWEMTGAAAFEKIRDSLRSVPVTSDPGWPNLGWRGFLVMNEGVEGLPQEIQVLHGVIRTEDQTGIHFYKDLHALEGWLQQQAETRGLFPRSSPMEQKKPANQ
jgi:hypothetical protein